MSLIRLLLVAFGASLLVTPLVRGAARRYGFIARPTGDRWHRKPTALLGGVAVCAATTLSAAVFLPSLGGAVAVGGAAIAMFLVGLVDDVVRLRPATKLTLQIAVASAAVWGGVRLGWTGSLTVDSVLTIFWLIATTNAFNLVDNMDGACAGVGAISAGTLVVLGAMSGGGPGPAAGLAAALCGALGGFLVYNFRPASIFLGDGGNLFVGFLLGGLTAAGEGQPNLPFAVVMLPVLVLAVPIFDTTLVTVARKLSGRPASQGGTDHTAHRLVALGFSEVNAVLFLYVLAGLAGVAAVGLRYRNAAPEIFVVVLGLALALLAVALLRVRAYGGRDYSVVLDGRVRPLTEFLVRQHVFELLFDLLLVAVAYYASYRIRFDASRFPLFFPTFLRSLPIVIACQIVSLRFSGAYGAIWRYFGSADLVPIVRGVFFGAGSSSLVLVFLYRFENVSRGVFLIYGVLLTSLLIGSRIALRLLPEFASSRGAEGRRLRALALGAGDAGSILVREITHNRGYEFQIVGFLDDDPLKRGKRIRGVPVLGDSASLAAIVTSGSMDAVILSSDHLDPAVVRDVATTCSRIGVRLLRFRCVVEEVEQVAPSMLEGRAR